ncbi:MAG: thiamine-phosphate kinase [Candidatus Abyssobacteria bacterium SURF_17]|jgi:thiamine-monophosphate kinase|uniref:Thiamine-monophosphate kinase n=1 Tax=Candidatus Abyssobacteria bacterium SURF_17 TaxID=2093361 RepID=A0A419F5U3_9BACT|nr:MAG: thiamine-phosphate kinase [Candidatus Abyssubacteria bacterium SURF_17]
MVLVGDRGEFDLIKLLTDGLSYTPQTIVGVGDDCAVYEISKGKYLLATCDMLIEDVHFTRKTASAFLIGCKAIACSLSDIAAMGGHPLFALISLGLPETTPEEFATDLYVGIRSMCRDHQVALIGGDTVRSPDKVVIDVSMLGDCPKGKFILRSGAKSGDAIVVTGYLGDSAAGLDLLNKKVSESDSERRSELVQAHLAPEPRCQPGIFLAENFDVHAMIDVSDGLAGDLGHICEQSKLGARIHADKIPVSDTLKEFCRAARLDPLAYAVTGGEDYELLFTLSPKELACLKSEWPEEFELPLTHIGEMDKAIKGINIVSPDGREQPLQVRSYEHFKKR